MGTFEQLPLVMRNVLLRGRPDVDWHSAEVVRQEDDDLFAHLRWGNGDEGVMRMRHSTQFGGKPELICCILTGGFDWNAEDMGKQVITVCDELRKVGDSFKDFDIMACHDWDGFNVQGAFNTSIGNLMLAQSMSMLLDCIHAILHHDHTFEVAWDMVRTSSSDIARLSQEHTLAESLTGMGGLGDILGAVLGEVLSGRKGNDDGGSQTRH